MSAFFFLDIEASGLDGYPIEIAWCDADGNTESHLIRPITNWTHWDPKAERLHGMSRRMLLAEGEMASEVGKRALAVLSNSYVLSDDHGWDQDWLGMLIETCGSKVVPGVSPILPFLADSCGNVTDRRASRIIDGAIEETRHLVTHRAATDAHRHWMTWQAVLRRAKVAGIIKTMLK